MRFNSADVTSRITITQEINVKKRFDLSKLDFVEFEEYKPRFVFADAKGEKHQIEMTTDSAHAGVSLFY